jgi:hypothetical protein
VRDEGCLPSSRFPSDHLPLIAAFRLGDPPATDGAHYRVPSIAIPQDGALGAAPEVERSGSGMLISPKRSRDGHQLRSYAGRLGGGLSPPSHTVPEGSTGAEGSAMDDGANTALDPNAKPFTLPSAQCWYGPALYNSASPPLSRGEHTAPLHLRTEGGLVPQHYQGPHEQGAQSQANGRNQGSGGSRSGVSGAGQNGPRNMQKRHSIS